ncbi:MAG TPA: CRISPR-associated ring nuclease Csm6 [Haliangiales bacterium]|nr:CRISPR-associated ring nuclease Csm6 [Haliangiales bacterium]
MKPSKPKRQPPGAAPSGKSVVTAPGPKSRPPEGGTPNASHSEKILLAVTGMSPAVLTETVWALAQEKPPAIPDRVIVLTTLPGKARIEGELFKPSADYGNLSVWQSLRRAVLGPDFENDARLNLDEVRLIARRDSKLGRSFPLEDIRTPADNEVAADFILEELRKLTENADTQIIASLAGGRKTMGALLYAALSLLGRARDRLTHVLVSEPFEDPGLTPRFYFPAQPETLHQHPRTGGIHRGDAARLWLADVPFVRLRELFPRQLGRYPGKFSALVQSYAERIEVISGPPEVAIDDADLSLRVNGVRVPLAQREFALFAFLLQRCHEGATPYRQQKDAVDDFKQWLATWGKRFGPFTRQRELVQSWASPTDEDLRKQLSSARAKFKQAGLGRFESYLLPQRGAFALRIKLVK